MTHRKTSGDYSVEMSIVNEEGRTKLSLRVRGDSRIILVREQTYEATGLGLLLETEFEAVVDTIVSDMETL